MPDSASGGFADTYRINVKLDAPPEPGERKVDYRPEGRWGPSYIGVVGKVHMDFAGEDFLVDYDMGPLKKRWPLRRRLVWLLRGCRA